ncbi:MAG TPA: hypothetical protein VK335_08150 [Bryobacteraceae bacterium]|nr:hypothetical protein [Bryobacteraceae bacterium]
MSKFILATEDLIINMDTVTHVLVKANGEMDIFIIGRAEPIVTAKGKQAEQLKGDLEVAGFRMAT